MQDYINLINFLKENDEKIKKDLETLQFGTEISRCWSKYKMLNPWEFFDENNRTFYLIDDICFRWDKLNIIWNNLDYHHIMMYCENRKLNLIIAMNWNITSYKKESSNITIYQTWIKFDYTKPFHKQEPIVYKALLDYFIWL